jgi:cytochrome P450
VLLVACCSWWDPRPAPQHNTTHLLLPLPPQGPRNCLGQHLALLEARVVLALLSKRFNFKMHHQRKLERHPTVIPCSPLGGLEMLVE